MVIAWLGLGIAFVIGLALVFGAALGDNMSLALGVMEQPHAEARHVEAPAIRQCLDNNGPYMIWKHKFAPTWYLICQIDADTWGLQAVNREGVEKTAFSPGDGSYRALMDYLRGFATKFKGGLPWLQ
jgi:hypothetical protein